MTRHVHTHLLDTRRVTRARNSRHVQPFPFLRVPVEVVDEPGHNAIRGIRGEKELHDNPYIDMHHHGA